MHEMAVTQAMLNMALEHAHGQRITDIYLQVGRLSAIVPDSVDVFFEYLSKDTFAEGATLHYEIAPVAMTCMDCGEPADTSEWVDQSPQTLMLSALNRGCRCGSNNLRVTVGFRSDESDRRVGLVIHGSWLQTGRSCRHCARWGDSVYH
jgi:hydrogenase nickel incorporation protein HypA/HybF